MSERGKTNPTLRVKVDDDEAHDRATALACDPKVRAWMRRARKLMREIPDGTRIYWQEDDHLPDGPVAGGLDVHQ